MPSYAVELCYAMICDTMDSNAIQYVISYYQYILYTAVYKRLSHDWYIPKGTTLLFSYCHQNVFFLGGGGGVETEISGIF